MLVDSTRQGSSITFKNNYEQWLSRVQTIRNAYITGQISDQDLKHYQLYILDFGHYNANYTLAELNRLHYPKSPFANMHRHTYIRGTESWPVEILRRWYQSDMRELNQAADSKQSSPNLYPIFLDSAHFWSELNQYGRVIDAPSSLADTELIKFVKKIEVINNKPEYFIDVNRWYRDNDISEFIECVVEQRHGGYEHGARFLIANPHEAFTHQCVLEAVDTRELALPIDYNFDYTRQPTPQSVDNRRDVFQELFQTPNSLQTKDPAKVQILFPYNITNKHWLTCEIIIAKVANDYKVNMWAHNPYGKGKMQADNFKQIMQAIRKRIKSYDHSAKFAFNNLESVYNARQNKSDASSCGVITARDIVTRLSNLSLNNGQVFPVGALNLREEQLAMMAAHNRYINFVERNTVLSCRDCAAIVADNKNRQTWVRLREPGDKCDAEKNLKAALMPHIIEKYAKSDVKEEKEALKEILKKFQIKSKKLMPKEITILEKLLHAQIKKVLEKENAKSSQTKKRNIKWYNVVFGRLIKSNGSGQLLTEKGLNNPEELMNYAEENPSEFENLYNALPKNNNKPKSPNMGIYRQAYEMWKNTHIDKILGQTYFFIQRKYRGLDVLVLVGHDEAERNDDWGPKALVNRLGFRVEYTRAVYTVLDRYPSLFINKDETAKFWRELVVIPMIMKLPLDEKSEIISLVDDMWGRDMIRRDLVPKGDIICSRPYQDLINNCDLVKSNFKYYAEFLIQYVSTFNKLHHNSLMKFILKPELLLNLHRFNVACKDENMPQATRAVQCITEFLRLDLSLLPYKPDYLLTKTVKSSYFSRYPVQSVLFSTYGMRSYARVLQASDYPLNIAVTNQNYFEWLLGLGYLDDKRNIQHLRYLHQLDASTDVLFMEIHPNSFADSKQFSQCIDPLFEHLQDLKCLKQPKTIVVDATLNAFNDDEIQYFLSKASTLILSGYLNIVLIQSLTKFSQAGVDQRSGGVMVVINNQKNWQQFNLKCEEIKRNEPTPVSTLHYFSYFFNNPKLTRLYISHINSAVRYVYSKIMDNLVHLETGTKQRFQLTMSSDARGCYVALNMRGILSSIDSSFKYTRSDIENFGQAIIKGLVVPLCKFLNYPITQRMSIGFPLSSINNVFDSLRFTIGIEPIRVLDGYADIMVFISFVLNRFNNIALLFEQDDNKKFTKRTEFFAEKVSQFMALTPGANYLYTLRFSETNENNRIVSTKIVSMKNGEVQLTRNDGQRAVVYNNDTIRAYIQGKQFSVPLKGIRISLRRMILATITQLQSQNDMSINLVFDNRFQTLSLSFHIISLWDAHMLYGPFISNRGNVYFYLHGNEIYLLHNEYTINQNHLFIKQGHMTARVTDMPFEERDFFFKASDYEVVRRADQFLGGLPFSQRIDLQYIPLRNEQMRVTFQGDFVYMTRDFICAEGSGITIYKRFFNDDNTGVEIDYWQEKDPVKSRFFCLAIALCANILEMPTSKKRGFQVRQHHRDCSTQFTHFLFHLPFDDADGIFGRAMFVVFEHRAALIELLRANKTRIRESGQYSFFSEHVSYATTHGTADTSAYGQCWIEDRAWVEEIINTIDLHPLN